MKKIVILALRSASASSITGPMDAFVYSGVLWNVACGREPSPCFDVVVASADGRPVKCANRLYMEPHCAIHDVKEADLVMVPAMAGSMDAAIDRHLDVIDWLTQMHRLGTHIASTCTGAFLLARTGLLDGKTATTHWGFADEFRSRFPLVRLRPECLITDEGDLYCSGGSNSCMDISLYLIEKLSSREVAVQCSKAMVQDFGRVSQSPYAEFMFQKTHDGRDIVAVQQWMEENYTGSISVSALAGRFGMSKRTLERRFKKLTGDSPLIYLQKLRINAARALLEKPHSTFEEATYRVGYEDISSFRKIFQRHTGLLPKEYQRLFQKNFPAPSRYKNDGDRR